MNKKFSTLMAVFLAAGATFTVEAGVVKVTKVIDGKKYVIADANWNVGASKPVLTKSDDGTGVIGIIGDASKYSTLPLWTVVKSGSEQLLKNENGSYLDVQSGTTISLQEVLNATNQKLTYAEATPSIKIGAQTNYIKFGDATVVGSTVTYPITDDAAGKAAFYAETYDAADNANLVITLANNDQVLLKVEDKYVAAKAKTGTDVELISIDWANPDYNDVLRATWKYNSSGTTYESVYTSEGTNKYLGLSGNSLALAAANGVNFDGGGYAAIKKAALTNTDGSKAFNGVEFVEYKAENQDKQPEALLYKAPTVITATHAGAIDARQFVNGGWYYVSTDASNCMADNGTPGSPSFAAGAVDPTNVLENTYLWKVEVKNIAGSDIVTLLNKATNNYYTVTGVSSFTAETVPAYTAGMVLKTKTAGYINAVATSGGADVAAALKFGLHLPGNVNYTAAELNAMTSNGFSMSISTAKENGSTSIEGANTFAGILKAVNANGNRFQLTDADGKYIVLSKTEAWGTNTDMNGNNSNNRGLKFSKVTTVDASKQYSYFEIKYPQVNDKASNEELVIEVYDAATSGNLVGRMYVGSIAGKNYLTVSKDIDATKEIWPYVSLGGSDLVNLKTFLQKGKFYTVARVDAEYQIEKVLGTASNGDAALLDKGAVQMDQPEGQWAASVKAGKLILTNRESLAEYTDLGVLYGTDKDNVYKNGDKLYLIKVVEKHDATDGYEAWTNNQLRDEQYTLGFYSNVLGATAYMSENHSNKHLIGLEKDIKNATAWDVKAFDAKRTDAAQTDSVYVVSNLYFWNKDKKGGADWDIVADTLKTVSYTFTNASNGEPVKYNAAENAYICDPTANVEGDRFAIKKMADGKYNLVAVSTNDAKEAADKYYTLASNKLYGGFSVAQGNVNATGKYDKSENDLVVIEKTAAPEYVKRSIGDTIRIFREGAEASILFEKGEFLGLENIHEFTKMAPAMYVDTAYYNRGTNNRWQYLLGVEIERKVVSDDCGIPSHEKFHADTTYGRFLVNLVDSAELYKKTHLHDNKYVNTESFAKLGFVKGFHTNDTLVIQRNGVLIPAKADSIYMGSKDFNVAKFAFRIVDHETNAFKIETLYKKFSDAPAATVANLGYLKWMNGFVVVVNDINNGDTFNLAVDHSTPTDNESINGAAAFSVASIDGAVVVKGAEGKNVVISNVLGQTITSAAITSSEATIAVPAGVVVVAVEGEAAVKAIVK